MPQRGKTNKRGASRTSTKERGHGSPQKGFAHVAISMRSTAKPASVQSVGGGGLRISHREYIADISLGPAWAVAFEDLVNPGKPTGFPWASAMANRFEEYRFTKLVYEYVPRCPTSTGGQVDIAFDFDPSDPLPADKSIMRSFHMAQTGVVWDMLTLQVPPEQMRRLTAFRFTRSGAYPLTDLKLYDVGRIIVAGNSPVSTTVGELFVSYTVELQIPQRRIAGPEASGALKVLAPTWGDPWVNLSSVLSGLSPATSNLADFLEKVNGTSLRVLAPFSGVIQTKTESQTTAPSGRLLLWLSQASATSAIRLLTEYMEPLVSQGPPHVSRTSYDVHLSPGDLLSGNLTQWSGFGGLLQSFGLTMMALAPSLKSEL